MTDRTVAERLAAALEQRDVDAIAALYAEDAVMLHPLSPEGVRGREAISESEQALLDAFSDVEVEIRSLLADDRHCAAEVVLRATNTGPLDVGGDAPAAATGRRIELPSSWWFELRGDGTVAEERDYFDPAVLMSQLGFVG